MQEMKEKYRQFGCWISIELYKKIREKGWKYDWIVQNGFDFLNGQTNTNEQIKDLTLTIEKQSKAIQRLQYYINELQTNDLQLKESIEKDKIENKEG